MVAPRSLAVFTVIIAPAPHFDTCEGPKETTYRRALVLPGVDGGWPAGTQVPRPEPTIGAP